MRPEGSTDITRVVLFVLVIGALLLGSFWTLLPFLSGLIWATTIAVATWPLLLQVQRLTGGRRAPAVAIMTLLVLMAFILPFAVAISTLIDAAERSPTVMSAFLSKGMGPPPEWIAKIPAVGEQLADRWQTVAAGGPAALAAIVQPYARAAATWALAATGGFGRTIVLILLTVLLVTILYSQGENAARGALAFANRLGGETGERTLRLAGQAVRSVALGVVLTALVQSVLAGLGLWFCGIPLSRGVTAIAFGPRHRASRSDAGVVAGDHLAVLDRQHRLGNRAPGVECAGADARQHPAAGLDSPRRGAAAAADHRRRHRRIDQFWRGRPVRGPRRARGDLHAREGLGRSYRIGAWRLHMNSVREYLQAALRSGEAGVPQGPESGSGRQGRLPAA